MGVCIPVSGFVGIFRTADKTFEKAVLCGFVEH